MDLDSIRQSVFNGILADGYVVQPVEHSQHGAYAYTVGRTMHGRPELLVACPSPEANQRILDDLVSRDADVPLAAGQELIVEGTPVLLAAAEPASLIVAIAAFTKITALQVVWLDAAGIPVPGQPLLQPGHLFPNDPYGD